jgi:hypothetical protein
MAGRHMKSAIMELGGHAPVMSADAKAGPRGCIAIQ